jgi:hypothetical protein
MLFSETRAPKVNEGLFHTTTPSAPYGRCVWAENNPSFSRGNGPVAPTLFRDTGKVLGSVQHRGL